MTGFARDQLETLVVLVDEGTFEATAGRLHITASAVSQRVKAMEQRAGQILVERSNPVRTTPAGDVVLRLARQVQLVETEALTELGQAGVGEGTARPVIPIAVNADSLATWFLPALAAAAERLDVVFDVRRDDQGYTTAMLRSGSVMAAVTSTPEPVQGCSVTPLGVMRYRAVASPSFLARFRGDGGLASWLPTAPHLDFDRRDDLQQGFLRQLVPDAPALPAPRHYVPTSADFARAIVAGLGWGMLPEQQCGAELGRGDLEELAPHLPADVPLFWQRWNLASTLLDGLTVAVRRAAATSLRAA
ncbi:transcriptional regulator ArgP [Subtercola boreus]|uniref:Transcriptional regulator ArgP n=1 Tax=Subtercola boreus TaxID=120213 RepID=A0A3E0VL80_9MICO|nr:LysR family transcriptional regulator ArgP [Subtercola boreus]RFA10180.1 transcriptional regulator ArgP [Subtercola boreus]TQL52654.1 LysR family transcriptional regulator [Subtercola boreus]